MDFRCVCDWTSTSRIRLDGFEGEGGETALHTTLLDVLFTQSTRHVLGWAAMECCGTGRCGWVGVTGLGSLGRGSEKGPA